MHLSRRKLRLRSFMTADRAMVACLSSALLFRRDRLSFGYHRNKSLAYRLNNVNRNRIACLFVALRVRYARLLDGFVRFVRKTLESKTLKRCKFTDAIFRRIADCYAVLVLRRKCKRFLAVPFEPTYVLTLLHTLGRKDWSDF